LGVRLNHGSEKILFFFQINFFVLLDHMLVSKINFLK
jgi:hypothetical protein